MLKKYGWVLDNCVGINKGMGVSVKVIGIIK